MIALCLAGFVQVIRGSLIPAKAVAAQFLLERAFDRSLALHRPQKPWPWADMATVARINVPRLRIRRIVLDSGSGQAMAFGPTVLPDAPAIGQPGTIVLAAHRDTHFRFLQHIRRGDRIDVQGVDGRQRRYRVVGAEIVRWDGFAIEPGRAADEIDLATCYPFGAFGRGPLRYVVRARAVVSG